MSLYRNTEKYDRFRLKSGLVVEVVEVCEDGFVAKTILPYITKPEKWFLFDFDGKQKTSLIDLSEEIQHHANDTLFSCAVERMTDKLRQRVDEEIYYNYYGGTPEYKCRINRRSK